MLDIAKVTKPSIQGLFSSIFGGFSGSSTPHRAVTPLPAPEPEPEMDLLTDNQSSVALTIYSADVTTKLDKKFTTALHRSTKKEPPSRLRYELIYVSNMFNTKPNTLTLTRFLIKTGKSEYDASIQEDAKFPSSTGSIFQGLRADIEG